MKKLLVTLACLTALGAQAQTQTTSAQPSGFRGIVGLGLTFGGDQVGRTIQYQNSSDAKIHAGGLADFRGGVEYQLQGQPIALEMTIGYHFDKANAENGNAEFSRFPLDLIGHFAMTENVRLGLGVRKSLNTKAASSGVGGQYVSDAKYTSSLAPVLEVEYFMTPQFAFRGRYVSESFKPTNGGEKLDGSHFGIYGMVYF
ncbi:MAG: hypothetical protein RI907_466 [Pseudomonadota bacterium]